jgi:ABC-type branched-subunit amino acid transport system substrate-binding protein
MLLLPACAVPRPTIKIALVAPFEGRFREVGYAAFPALRLALREQIRSGGIGNYQVEFVAYNDNADPAYAARVAHNVVLDERVVAIIGHLRLDTTLSALHVYTDAQMPVVVPDVPADRLPDAPFVYRLAPATTALDAGLSLCHSDATPIDSEGPQPFRGLVPTHTLAFLPDFQSPAAPRLLGTSMSGLCFATPVPYPHDLPAAVQALSGFSEVAGGPAPGPRSISAYDATRLVLQAIRADIDAHGTPTRAGVAEALKHVAYDGLMGRIAFDAHNSWTAAPVWVYQYDSAGAVQLLK